MVKEKFYSNCLFTALSVKIKNPKNTKIIFLPKKITGFGSHFVWWDKEKNTVSHFSQTKTYNLKNPLNWLRQAWFEGKIKTVSKETYDRYVSVHILNYKVKKINALKEKLGVTDFMSKSSWKEFNGILPSYEDGLPLTKRVPYVICKFYNENGEPDFKAVKLEKEKQSDFPKNIDYYKYPSIADDDFNCLWGNYKDYFKVNSDFE